MCLLIGVKCANHRVDLRLGPVNCLRGKRLDYQSEYTAKEVIKKALIGSILALFFISHGFGVQALMRHKLRNPR
jgi:hypothetical protein